MRLPRCVCGKADMRMPHIGLVSAFSLTGLLIRLSARAWRCRRLARLYASKARQFKLLARAFRNASKAFRVAPADLARVAELEEQVTRDRASVRYFARLARKYRRAARYPWLPVAPDPPEPE